MPQGHDGSMLHLLQQRQLRRELEKTVIDIELRPSETQSSCIFLGFCRNS